MADDISKDETNMTLNPVKRKKGSKAKTQFNILTGIVHVSATFNNTIVSVGDMNGNIISWCSAGKLGYKGTKKGTAYAAQMVAIEAVKRAMTYGLKKVEVWIKGPGLGRESAVRGVSLAGVDVLLIKDITAVPHNGCRPPKRRRV